MELKIVNEIQNELLGRKEVELSINHLGEAIPKRDTVLAKIAALMNKERNQVVLIKMEGQYGKGESVAIIHVYDTAEQAKSVEKTHFLKRSGIIKAENKEE